MKTFRFFCPSRRPAPCPTACHPVLAALVLIVVPLAAVRPLQAARSDGARPESIARIRPDRAIVKPRNGADIVSACALLGGNVVRVYRDLGNLHVLEFPADVRVTEALATLRNAGLVDLAEPDYILRLQDAQPDATRRPGLLALLWHGEETPTAAPAKSETERYVPASRPAGAREPRVIVAVLDTGVRYTDGDVAPLLWINPRESGPDRHGVERCVNLIDDDGDGYIDDVHGIDLLDGSGNPWDEHGHGTRVTRVLADAIQHALGPDASAVALMPIKLFNRNGEACVSDALEAIEFARKKNARILNASWGSPDFVSSALQTALRRARADGMIVVAAAGNRATDDDAHPIYPAGFPFDNILRVAATTRGNELAATSDFGRHSIDLAAPGYLESAPVTRDTRGNVSTSMAVPHVAAACALVWAREPEMSYREVMQRVLDTVDPLPSLAGKVATGGRVNIARAFALTPP